MDHLLQIAQRLKGLREAMDITVEAMAAMCDVDADKYALMERGEADIAMSTLQRIASKCGVELPALLFGDEPRMSSYFVTRRGQGAVVERSKAYRYRSLAAGLAMPDRNSTSCSKARCGSRWADAQWNSPPATAYTSTPNWPIERSPRATHR